MLQHTDRQLVRTANKVLNKRAQDSLTENKYLNAVSSLLLFPFIFTSANQVKNRSIISQNRRGNQCYFVLLFAFASTQFSFYSMSSEQKRIKARHYIFFLMFTDVCSPLQAMQPPFSVHYFFIFLLSFVANDGFPKKIKLNQKKVFLYQNMAFITDQLLQNRFLGFCFPGKVFCERKLYESKILSKILYLLNM